MLAEIERRINEENARPKKRYISPSTREEVYAIYYDGLRRKIEDKGTHNFPEVAGRKLYGELTMVVTVNFDGKVLDTEVVETSGTLALDRRAPDHRARGRAVRAVQRRDAPQGRPDRRRVALQVHPRRDARNETDRPMTTDLYCVMGNPVEHSKSPWIHARFAQLTGQDLRYGKRLVPLGGFADAVRAFRAEGGKGCNVTVPFKFDSPALATQLTARAQLAQACNTLRFDGEAVLGDNTDGVGLVNDIRENAGVDLAGRDVLVAGAGGAAAGVLGPLIDARPRRIVVANRTQSRAAVLIERHRELAQRQGVELLAPELADLQGRFDVVVNATASSMSGAAVPVPASVLNPGALACDLMYGPAAQPFMAWARENGALPRDGLGMLVEQAAEAFLVWRGVRPPSAQVLAELRAAL